MEYETLLNEMISNKNLMNSYKLYFLKALLINVSVQRESLGFYEMACWMCAYSFSDVRRKGGRIRPLDRLFDIAVLAIETEDLMESSRTSEVFEALFNTDNKKLKHLVYSLCDYVPYRLLSCLWPRELKGITGREKNRMIERLSRSEKECIYSIYSDTDEEGYIEVNADWARFISDHRNELVEWIDKKIRDFIWKEE